MCIVKYTYLSFFIDDSFKTMGMLLIIDVNLLLSFGRDCKDKTVLLIIDLIAACSIRVACTNLIASLIIVPTCNTSLWVNFPKRIHIFGVVKVAYIAKRIDYRANQLVGVITIDRFLPKRILHHIIPICGVIVYPTLLVSMLSSCMDTTTCLVILPIESIAIAVSLGNHSMIEVLDVSFLIQGIGNAYHISLAIVVIMH